MAAISVRDLDDDVAARLKVRAARSMEAEARAILTAVVAAAEAEIEYGLARLPGGRRKDRLTAAASRVFGDFDDVILAFGMTAARCYGEIVAAREQRGRPISAADGRITAICSAERATLATRNIGDFDDTGIDVISPWEL